MVGEGRVVPFETLQSKRGLHIVYVTRCRRRQAEDGQRRQRQRQRQLLQRSLDGELRWRFR